MNDNDVLWKIRDSVPGVHMDMPVDAIVARGRSRRRRRLSGLTAAGAAAGIALTLGLTGVMSSGNTPPAATSHGAQLAAFTVVSGPDGTSTLTLRKGKQYRLDPSALRQALAQHGIPALVTVGSMCNSNPAPGGLDQVLSTRRLADGTVVTTFNPAAMPAGSKLSIGYFQTHTTFALIDDGAPLTCGSNPGSSHRIVRRG